MERDEYVCPFVKQIRIAYYKNCLFLFNISQTRQLTNWLDPRLHLLPLHALRLLGMSVQKAKLTDNTFVGTSNAVLLTRWTKLHYLYKLKQHNSSADILTFCVLEEKTLFLDESSPCRYGCFSDGYLFIFFFYYCQSEHQFSSGLHWIDCSCQLTENIRHVRRQMLTISVTLWQNWVLNISVVDVL